MGRALGSGPVVVQAQRSSAHRAAADWQRRGSPATVTGVTVRGEQRRTDCHSSWNSLSSLSNFGQLLSQRTSSSSLFSPVILPRPCYCSRALGLGSYQQLTPIHPIYIQALTSGFDLPLTASILARCLLDCVLSPRQSRPQALQRGNAQLLCLVLPPSQLLHFPLGPGFWNIDPLLTTPRLDLRNASPRPTFRTAISSLLAALFDRIVNIRYYILECRLRIHRLSLFSVSASLMSCPSSVYMTHLPKLSLRPGDDVLDPIASAEAILDIQANTYLPAVQSSMLS